MGQSAPPPFLTGPCATADSFADLSDVVDQPDRAPALPRDFDIPPYPESLRRAGYQGTVVLGVVVNANGHVRPGTATVLSSTDTVLSRWACAAAPRLRLEPAQVHGRAVATQTAVPFTYRGSLPPLATRADSLRVDRLRADTSRASPKP